MCLSTTQLFEELDKFKTGCVLASYATTTSPPATTALLQPRQCHCVMTTRRARRYLTFMSFYSWYKKKMKEVGVVVTSPVEAQEIWTASDTEGVPLAQPTPGTPKTGLQLGLASVVDWLQSQS